MFLHATSPRPTTFCPAFFTPICFLLTSPNFYPVLVSDSLIPILFLHQGWSKFSLRNLRSSHKEFLCSSLFQAKSQHLLTSNHLCIVAHFLVEAWQHNFGQLLALRRLTHGNQRSCIFHRNERLQGFRKSLLCVFQQGLSPPLRACYTLSSSHW